jgi:hypothetical protein
VARTSDLPKVLWLVTSTWLAGCGRIGFEAGGADAGPPIGSAVGPRLDLLAAPAMTTTCGRAPATYDLTVRNSGDRDLVIDKVTVTGDPFGVIAIPATLRPGESGTITLAPPRAVVGTDLPDDTKRGQLVIQANTDAPVAPVDVTAKVIGANLTIIAPSPFEFSAASGLCPAARNVVVKNLGNADASIEPQLPLHFAISGLSGGVIAAGAMKTVAVRAVTSAECAGSGRIVFEASEGAICKAPAPLNATFNITGSSSCACS